MQSELKHLEVYLMIKLCFVVAIKTKPNNKQIKTTPKLIPIPINIPMPAPSKEL